MSEIPLECGLGCRVEVEVHVPGWAKSRTLKGLVDTGAVVEGVGLVLARAKAPRGRRAPSLGVTKVSPVHGRAIFAKVQPNGQITRIGPVSLSPPWSTTVLFLGKAPAILGWDAIRRGILTVDGPGARAKFEIKIDS